MNKAVGLNSHPEHSPDWHSLPTQEVLRALAVDHAGLTTDEAARCLQQYGPNRLPAAPRDSLLVRFVR